MPLPGGWKILFLIKERYRNDSKWWQICSVSFLSALGKKCLITKKQRITQVKELAGVYDKRDNVSDPKKVSHSAC